MESVPTTFAVLDILGYGALMRHEPDEILILVQELIKKKGVKKEEGHPLKGVSRKKLPLHHP